MELRDLQGFAEVARSLHFGQAAARLHLTRPALSQRIRHLERELGTTLFDTSRGVVRITEAGKELLPYATRMVEEHERALLNMRRFTATQPLRLRVGQYFGGAHTVSTRLIQLFAQRNPEVQLEVGFDYSLANLEKLRRTEVDLAFVKLPMYDLKGIEVVVVVAEPLLLAIPAGHELARHRRIQLARLGGQPLILFPRSFNPAEYDYLKGTVEAATGTPTSIVAERATQEAMVSSVADGIGLSFCSQRISRQLRAANVAFRHLDGAKLVSRLGVLARRQDRSRATRSFLKYARSESEQLLN